MAIIDRLPHSEYVRLNYLQSQGNQWIDAGFKPTGATRFEIKWNSLRTSRSPNMTIFGARQDWNMKQFQLTDYETSSVKGYFGYSNTSANWNTLNYNGNYDLEVSYLGTTFTTSNGISKTISAQNYNVGKNMYIFALNANGSVSERSSFRLYYLKFYNGSTLIRDFIPVYNKTTGELGLYDKVNNVFYSNQGSGSFIGA